jgi:hypothetical protein
MTAHTHENLSSARRMLQFAADYIGECDEIIGSVLRLARDQGRADISDDQLAFVTGRELQNGLRQLADQLTAVCEGIDAGEFPLLAAELAKAGPHARNLADAFAASPARATAAESALAAARLPKATA